MVENVATSRLEKGQKADPMVRRSGMVAVCARWDGDVRAQRGGRGRAAARLG
jgi:hypothetical protein